MTAVAPDRQTCRAISSLLRANGAGDTCLVISENSAFDCRRMPLDEALDLVMGTNSGSILSCVPGRLAYYEGEEPSDRCIFARACAPKTPMPEPPYATRKKITRSTTAIRT
jgi:hypothetical protein